MPREPLLMGYCTNVHAGTSLEETVANLERFSVPVREHLELDRLGIGLWLPERAARELAQDNGAHRLRDRLESMGLFVFTMNGFPQGDFHAEVVKHKVYQPDWCAPERLAYTNDLARILVDLLPDGTREGSISTLPIAWGTGFDDVERALENLMALAGELGELEQRTGTLIHVDIEPEPGCVLDTVGDMLALFDRMPLDVRRHLRVCHDICHSAVMFEPQARVIEAYATAGIQVGKIQVSACPEIDFDALAPSERTHALDRLRSFAEPRYLHQATVRNADGETVFFEDLPQALEQHGPEGCWRTHFHVPIFAQELGGIQSTQSQILECLQAFGADVPPLEVETYAWGVLPDGLFQDDLAGGIAQELRWLHRLLEKTG